MSRRPHYCYYHSRFREEASKCKTSENEPKCEFQKLNEGIDKKPIQDLRSHIRTDKRKSLKTDLRVHLNKRNQRAEGKAKRPIQDLKSRLSRPRTHQEKEEDLFERRGNKRSKAELIHVSEIQIEEDPADAQNDEDRSLSTGRRRRSRERSQNETGYYRAVDVTKTISNDRYKPNKSENQILELKRIERMTKNKVNVQTTASHQNLTTTTRTTTEGPKLNPIQEKDPDTSQMVAETQVMFQRKIRPLPKEAKEMTKGILIQTKRTIQKPREEEGIATN